MSVASSRIPRRVRAGGAGAAAVLVLVASPAGGAAAARVAHPALLRSASVRCAATRVHYKPYAGAAPGLARLPWIAASPRSTGLVGHLFYYDAANVWRRQRLPGVRIYSGGQSPDGRVGMKILWELRHGSAVILRVHGTRLDGHGTFSDVLSPTRSSAAQFPSIITAPAAGCWRLTLRAGSTSGTVTMLAVAGKAG